MCVVLICRMCFILNLSIYFLNCSLIRNKPSLTQYLMSLCLFATTCNFSAALYFSGHMWAGIEPDYHLSRLPFLAVTNNDII